ncbi:hypothetical protein Q1695_011904 [Nippostrongylus brasiliensis]|nr:hypothetical protein Q1695_011904 [Nippostrongylus brasiliensis]
MEPLITPTTFGAAPTDLAEAANSTALPAPISSIRVFYPFVLFLSMISSADASGRCFNTEKGLTIDGGEYRRLRNIDHRGCALECRDDPSCLAYEWLETDSLCYLKSRSLSGDLSKKEDAIIGFCLDDDDEVRDRFRDHVALGPEVASIAGVEGEECKQACSVIGEAAVYSWTPDDAEDDEGTVGTCKCMEALRAIKLSFNSFSGFIGPRKWQLKKAKRFLLRSSRH